MHLNQGSIWLPPAEHLQLSLAETISMELANQSGWLLSVARRWWPTFFATGNRASDRISYYWGQTTAGPKNPIAWDGPADQRGRFSTVAISQTSLALDNSHIGIGWQRGRWTGKCDEDTGLQDYLGEGLIYCKKFLQKIATFYVEFYAIFFIINIYVYWWNFFLLNKV
jgi:hypothetical protein